MKAWIYTGRLVELKYSLKRGKLRLSEGHKYEERENRGLAPIEEGLDSRRVLTRAYYLSIKMEWKRI